MTVQNVYLRGIQASTTFGSFTFADNTITNVQGDGESVGVANIQGGSGTISGNEVDGATTGISTNFSLGTTIRAIRFATPWLASPAITMTAPGDLR